MAYPWKDLPDLKGRGQRDDHDCRWNGHGSNLYIADYGNARIRKVTPSGIISTVIGN